MTIAVFADELFLWTGAKSSGGFDVWVKPIRTRWVRILPMKIVLVESSMPNPVRHDGLMIGSTCTIGSACWWVRKCRVRR